LAILWPKTHVTLLDRAGRRVDLAWRAVRWLGLENVDVRHGEALSEPPDWEGVVLRAVFPPERACEVVDAVLDPAGIAVIGLRGDTTPGAAAAISMSERTIRVVDLAPTVLDGRASLLIMGPREH
jgi:16S rRNA G527 N7-methylase RsmG